MIANAATVILFKESVGAAEGDVEVEVVDDPVPTAPPRPIVIGLDLGG